MKVVELDRSNEELWDRFVAENPAAELYHDHRWREVIEAAYEHQCIFLMAVAGNRARAILPLTVIKSRLFGNSLTSLPYVDAAGLVAQDGECREAMLDRTVAVARENQVDYLEIRQLERLDREFRVDTDKVTLKLKLENSEDAMLTALTSERRNRVSRAKKLGLEVEFGRLEFLDGFYDIWSRNMRDLGSPPHSKKFFKLILQMFPESSTVAMVKRGDIYIGAALCMFYKGVFCIPWVSSLRKYFKLYPNNILYWEAICRAIRTGCSWFDFGRSTPGTGTHQFKTRWRAEPVQLYWHFLTLKGREFHHASSDSRKRRMLTSVWRRLPLGLTRAVGPKIRRSITA
jgi:FemAB-related protein (PEP-CTERM system-associated)